MTRVLCIAEAGVNHNGSLDRALEMVAVAAGAGVDAVKFQTFRAGLLASAAAPKATYQKSCPGDAQSQLDMLRTLELDRHAHAALLAKCRAEGVEFLSTPFDRPSLDLLLELGVRRLKVSSGDLPNAPLLVAMARSRLPVILSTGMADLGDVELALGALAFGYAGTGAPNEAALRAAYASPEGQAALRDKVILLHCTTQYPAPFADVHLRAMDTLRAAFGLPVGYSDHTEGPAAALAAAGRGAVVVEKHFTLDRSLPGPDHRASMEPEELRQLAAMLRQVEAALGRPVKAVAPSEAPNRTVARKSLVAARRIRAGELFDEANLTLKRPGNGLAPVRLWDLLGRAADRDYAPDEVIRL
jgi:N-acetylneuraminate synthase